MPIRKGSIKLLPSSGVKPSLGNGYMNFAVEEQITRSWKLHRAIFAAPPTARPFTAQIEGLGKSQKALVIGIRTKSPFTGAMPRSRIASLAAFGNVRVWSPARLAPELKAFSPAPVHTATLTLSSFVMCSRMAKVSHC